MSSILDHDTAICVACRSSASVLGLKGIYPYSRLNKSVDITEIRISKVAEALQCHFSRNQRQLQNEFDRSVEVDGVKNLVTVRL